jgi:hypothetical protein
MAYCEQLWSVGGEWQIKQYLLKIAAKAKIVIHEMELKRQEEELRIQEEEAKKAKKEAKRLEFEELKKNKPRLRSRTRVKSYRLDSDEYESDEGEEDENSQTSETSDSSKMDEELSDITETETQEEEEELESVNNSSQKHAVDVEDFDEETQSSNY